MTESLRVYTRQGSPGSPSRSLLVSPSVWGQLKAIGAGTIGGGTSLIGSGAAAAAPATGRATAAESAGGPYNVVFIPTDQER
jgi:hypothetical protein